MASGFLHSSKGLVDTPVVAILIARVPKLPSTMLSDVNEDKSNQYRASLIVRWKCFIVVYIRCFLISAKCHYRFVGLWSIRSMLVIGQAQIRAEPVRIDVI